MDADTTVTGPTAAPSRGTEPASPAGSRPPTTRPRRRVLVVLGALSAFGPLSMDLYLPALPQLAEDLGSTDAAVQLSLSACMLGLALGQVVVGPLSDRVGRRTPLLVGVATYAVASLLCALAPQMGVLIACRLVQGLAGGAGIVIARAVVRDLFDTRAAAHVFSLLMMITGVAAVLAPVVGGQLLRVAPWPGLFVTLALVGAVLLAASAVTLPESLPPADRSTGGLRSTVRQFGTVLRDPGFVGYALVLASGSAVLFTYITMSPFVLQGGFGLSAQAFSAVFAVNSVGLIVAGRLAATLVGRIGVPATLRAGLVTVTTACAVLLVAVSLGAGLRVVLPVLFVAVSAVALVMPTATALGLADQQQRAGTASGLLGLAQFGLGGFIAPAVSVIGTGIVVMVAAMTTAGVLGLLAYVVVRRLPQHP